MKRYPLVVTVPIKTTNPNNGQTGNSRLAGIIRSRERAKQRQVTGTCLWAAWQAGLRKDEEPDVDTYPLVVTLTRVAPSSGLDPHDGLRAALKGPVDAVTDWLGFDNDRDPRVRWEYGQRRGRRGEYAVEIRIEKAARQQRKAV